uniref:SLC26A/SulP transporter domain-containing protein n=1 Tax=Timema shepardi TaxID=629360 RepID=A0A7R9ASS6_TIMSH|nr:unnamed protein product [Timema shepardi]
MENALWCELERTPFAVRSGEYSEQLRAALNSFEQLRTSPKSSEPIRTAPDSSRQLRTAPNISEKLQTAPNSFEKLRTAPNISEKLRTAPNSSEQLRTSPKSYEQLRTAPNRLRLAYETAGALVWYLHVPECTFLVITPINLHVPECTFLVITPITLHVPECTFLVMTSITLYVPGCTFLVMTSITLYVPECTFLVMTSITLYVPECTFLVMTSITLYVPECTFLVMTSITLYVPECTFLVMTSITLYVPECTFLVMTSITLYVPECTFLVMTSITLYVPECTFLVMTSITLYVPECTFLVMTSITLYVPECTFLVMTSITLYVPECTFLVMTSITLYVLGCTFLVMAFITLYVPECTFLVMTSITLYVPECTFLVMTSITLYVLGCTFLVMAFITLYVPECTFLVMTSITLYVPECTFLVMTSITLYLNEDMWLFITIAGQFLAGAYDVVALEVGLPMRSILLLAPHHAEEKALRNLSRDNPTMTDSEEAAVANLYLMEQSLRCPDTPTSGGLRRGGVMDGSSDCILTKVEKKSTKEQMKALVPWLKDKTRRAFTKKLLYKRLPVLSWLPRYSSADALGDVVAGITVGLTVIPQSLAYSNIAGLPAQYGLYGSFLGCFLYIVLGSCKDVPMGPTAIISMLTYQTTKGLDPAFAVLLCFLMGCVEVLMGLLGLGFVIDFISGPVSSGFTSAAALIIVTSQVKDVLGITSSGNTFIEMWGSLFQQVGDTRLGDTVMGSVCIIVLLLMRYMTMLKVGPKEPEQQTMMQRVTNKSLWLIGTSRNAVLVIICGLVGYQLSLQGEAPFKLIGLVLTVGGSGDILTENNVSPSRNPGARIVGQKLLNSQKPSGLITFLGGTVWQKENKQGKKKIQGGRGEAGGALDEYSRSHLAYPSRDFNTPGSITIVTLDRRIDGGLYKLPEVVFDASACLRSPIDDAPGCVHTDPQTAVLKCLHPAHMVSRQETPDSSCYIPPGLPAFQLPPFGFTRDSNTTVTFYEMTTSLGWGILILPLVGLLENIAICKAFFLFDSELRRGDSLLNRPPRPVSANGKPVDASQELLALGISNIGNSLVQGFPGSGSLSRSAVNNSSGVRTPMGGLYTGDTLAQPVVRGTEARSTDYDTFSTFSLAARDLLFWPLGVLVLVALLFFTPCFYFIPKASLAAIIIAAVIFMVEVHVVIPMWKTKKSDLIPGIGTFVGCLVFPLELGILIGIGINIMFILYHVARPKIAIEKCLSPEGAEYLLLTPDRCLIFPSVDYMRNLVTKHSIKQAVPVVIDCSHIYGADFTAAKVIECLTHDFSLRKQPLFFYNLKPSVVAIFKGLQPKGFVVFQSESELDDLIKGNIKNRAESQQELSIINVGTG